MRGECGLSRSYTLLVHAEGSFPRNSLLGIVSMSIAFF